MSATAIAVSAAANAQAAAAQAAANEAARVACASLVRGYEHDRSTVSGMREYAGCIERLYPEPMPDAVLIWAKIAVAVLLVSFVAGVANEFRSSSRWAGPTERFFTGGLFGLMTGCLGFLLVAGGWFGIKLLLA